MRTFAVRVLCVLGAVGLPAALLAAPAAGDEAVFEYTGGPQEMAVPADVCLLTIDASAAQGGASPDPSIEGNGPNGGLGGRTVATVTVTPGEPIFVYVGGAGADGTFQVRSPDTIPGGPGGFNGGGGGGSGFAPDAVSSGAGGGGASDVRRGGPGLEHRIVVAGGGAGGGGFGDTVDGFGIGGAGGGTSGGSPDGDGTGAASSGPDSTPAQGGTAGTATGPGLGGSGTVAPPPLTQAGSGADGGSGTGGAGGASAGDVPENVTAAGGGGGGGGWFGGGGGGGAYPGFNQAGGGGGGSSFAVPDATGVAMEAGVRSGNGRVIVSWDPGAQPVPCPIVATPRFTG